MRRLSSESGSVGPRSRWIRPSLLVLILLTLLLVWPTDSLGQDASVDSVRSAQADSLMLEAADEIDRLNGIVAKQDSLLVAQRDYYVELLALQDKRIEILEKAVEDAAGSDIKDLLEKVVWGLAGYGLHAAGSR